jgi:hypothetical protein
MGAVTIPEGGVGITLGYKIGSASVYTNIVWLKDDCEFSGFENAVIEIKILSSGNVTKVGGRTDNGSFTGSTYLVQSDATVAELLTLAASKILCSWQLMLPDGTIITPGVPSLTGSTYVFMGFVSSVKPGTFTGEDASTLDFEIAISGTVTITPAT